MTGNKIHTGRMVLRTVMAVLAAILVIGATEAPIAQQPAIEVLRVPNDGIQPLAELDDAGAIHLLYFSGDPAAGDLFYSTRARDTTAFTDPIRVNSQPGSVIAIGTVRGARVALGRDGRLHVAWMGSSIAEPRGPDDQSPMLYTRLRKDGTGFERQRNVIQHAYGLDGGGTVAADVHGGVYVLWHAQAGAQVGEAHRRVWLATSTDDGKTFGREAAISPAGVCGCCGMTATTDSRGRLYTLYRGFRDLDHRGMYLLASRGPGKMFERHLLEPWQIAACPMSTSAAVATDRDVIVAWETAGEVAWARMRPGGTLSEPVHPPGAGSRRKHPALAVAPSGDVMLVWTENTGWARGGSLHWQHFNVRGVPTTVSGATGDVPVWSRAAVVADREGRFTIIH